MAGLDAATQSYLLFLAFVALDGRLGGGDDV